MRGGDSVTIDEIMELIERSLFADIGYLGGNGRPEIRRVFCVWHKGIASHLISTNTSSSHVRDLMKSQESCLYFADNDRFEGVCLYGKIIPHYEPEYRRLLWHDGDEKYYPNGIDDDDYCVLEFIAESGRYYRYDGKGDITRGEMEVFDRGREYTDGYAKTDGKDKNGGAL